MRRTNPAIPTTMSIIIPGLGQLYLGDLKSALNSFMLTSGFALLFIHTALEYSLIDAAASVLPWYQRYYQGGYENAGKIALKKREKKLTYEYKKILGLITENYP